MNGKAAWLLVLCIMIVCPLLFSACHHEYYPEGTEFRAYISGTEDLPTTFEGIFHSMEIANREVSYRFHSSSGNGQLLLNLPEAFSPDLVFQKDLTYTIHNQVLHGWPSLYGLVVLHENEVMFIGVTDMFIGDKIKLGETLYPEFNQFFHVEQTAILDNHFITSRQCYDRITNTEITFTRNGDSISLHQGQSGQLGNYQVKLNIARQVEYAEGCYDAGLTGISYLIIKSG